MYGNTLQSMESLGGMCGLFFNEATFLLAKNPRVSKQGRMREICWHCKLSSHSDREKKKKSNFIRFFFCLWLITSNGINIVLICMIFNIKS